MSLKKKIATTIFMISFSLTAYGYGADEVFEDKLYLFQDIINSNECYSEFSEEKFSRYMGMVKKSVMIKDSQAQAWDSFVAAKREAALLEFREISMFCSIEELPDDHDTAEIKKTLIKELNRDTQLAKAHLRVLEEFNQAAGELIALLDDDQLELIGELLD